MRKGTFKKGHKKLGGRKKGTPNQSSRNLIQAIVRAAEQVGSDGKGKDGIEGYFQRLAGRKENHFVTLLRQAVQKQAPATEPQNEVVYSTEQDYRQALLDRGVHPTLLPPPPRDLDERPPNFGQFVLPNPPPGYGWALCKTEEAAEFAEGQPDLPARSDLGTEESAVLDKEQPDPADQVNAEENNDSREIKASGDPYAPPYGTPWNPAPGIRWEHNPYTRSFFPKPAN